MPRRPLLFLLLAASMIAIPGAAGAATAPAMSTARDRALRRMRATIRADDRGETDRLDELARAATWPDLFADAASARAGCIMTLAAMSGNAIVQAIAPRARGGRLEVRG